MPDFFLRVYRFQEFLFYIVGLSIVAINLDTKTGEGDEWAIGIPLARDWIIPSVEINEAQIPSDEKEDSARCFPKIGVRDILRGH